MYSKTNVNSKCSMRIIKGARDKPLWPVCPPRAGTSQPQNQAPQPFPDASRRTFRGETKNALRCSVTELAGRLPPASSESEAHRGEGNLDRGWALDCPGPSCPCLLQLRHTSQCSEKQATEWTAYIKSEGTDNVP